MHHYWWWGTWWKGNTVPEAHLWWQRHALIRSSQLPDSRYQQRLSGQVLLFVGDKSQKNRSHWWRWRRDHWSSKKNEWQVWFCGYQWRNWTDVSRLDCSSTTWSWKLIYLGQLPCNSHDDITYQSIAKAFGLKLKLHQEAFEKMKRLSMPHRSQPNFSWDIPSPALTAKLRMIELPTDESRDIKDQVIFPQEDLWVPVNVVNGNVHILPGVPKLFERLLDGLKPYLLPRLTDPEGKGIYRVLFSTPLAESAVAAYLTELAAKVEPKGIKVGSYPRWGKGRNTVTLVGKDKTYMESLVPEVEKGVEGRRISQEGEDDDPTEDKVMSQ